MAKQSRSEVFSKAIITDEDGRFIITEYTKDETITYDLTSVLEEWLEVDGISLTIKQDVIKPSNLED